MRVRGRIAYFSLETTATLLSGLTWLLLKNVEKYEMLKKEVREAFVDKDMSMETIAALPYLNACIKEALRMYPPVPNGMPRQAASDGSTVAGFYVPPNVSHHPISPITRWKL